MLGSSMMPKVGRLSSIERVGRHPAVPGLCIAAFLINSQYLHSLPLGAAALFSFLYWNVRSTEVVFRYGGKLFSIFSSLMLILGATTILGYVLYLLVDFSDLMIALLLAVITGMSLALRKWKSQYPEEDIDVPVHPQGKRRAATRNGKVSAIRLVLGLSIIVSIGYSLLFLTSARTSDSIAAPWKVVPPEFFLAYFVALSLTVYSILTGRIGRSESLVYATLLIIVPALAFTIVVSNPFTSVNTLYAEMNRQLFTYGRFTSDLSQPDAISSPIKKVLLQAGGHFMNVILLKFLQIDPFYMSLYSVPIIFTIAVSVTSYHIGNLMMPNHRKFALLLPVAFLFSQHNVFLFTPPGKPETLALGFLFVSLLFWFRYLRSHMKRELGVALVLTVAVILIHQYAGIVAICVALLALTSRVPNRNGIRVLKGAAIAAITISPIFLLLPALHYASGYANIQTEKFAITSGLDLGKTMNVLFPPVKLELEGGLGEILFSTVLNNFNYLMYALVALGIRASHRLGIDGSFTIILVALVVISLEAMVITENFIPTDTSYRFLFYASFFAFPLVAAMFYRASRTEMPTQQMKLAAPQVSEAD